MPPDKPVAGLLLQDAPAREGGRAIAPRGCIPPRMAERKAGARKKGAGADRGPMDAGSRAVVGDC